MLEHPRAVRGPGEEPHARTRLSSARCALLAAVASAADSSRCPSRGRRVVVPSRHGASDLASASRRPQRHGGETGWPQRDPAYTADGGSVDLVRSSSSVVPGSRSAETGGSVVDDARRAVPSIIRGALGLYVESGGSTDGGVVQRRSGLDVGRNPSAVATPRPWRGLAKEDRALRN